MSLSVKTTAASQSSISSSREPCAPFRVMQAMSSANCRSFCCRNLAGDWVWMTRAIARPSIDGANALIDATAADQFEDI